MKLLDKNHSTYGVIDLLKVFDTVNYEIFLSKLKHYGVKGTSHNWFK